MLLALGAFMLPGGTARAVPLDTLTISAPADMTVTGNQVCGQSDCAQVSYTFTVSGGVPPYHLVCTPVDSGGLFVVGTHTVSCFAQDSVGDSTPSASFTLTVKPPQTSGGGTGGGSSSGSGGGTSSGGSGGGTSSGGAGGSASTTGGSTTVQTNTHGTVRLGGVARVGHVLTARVTNGTAKHYVWQLKRAGTWRRLIGQTTARLRVKTTYTGHRLRVRVTLTNGRVLYSSTTAPVHH